MADMNNAEVPVQITDNMTLAIQDAMARIEAVKASKPATLVDQISDNQWENWDASGERALVSDSEGVDSVDEFEDAWPIAG